MVSNQVMHQQIVYFQDTTTNQSFMDMHYILRAKGIQNNKFFLAIYDPSLMGVDPRDPLLDRNTRIRIWRECRINFWYFIREVVRIPDEGGSVGAGARYKLHRGNLAMNYLFIHNYDMFVDLPRQHFKTVSALVWYLWVFNFGSTNTQMMFINKKHDDSKGNLRKMKDLRSSLPDFLQMDSAYDAQGNKVKAPNTAETLQHPMNRNTIKTLPAARTKALADGAGRGCTMAIQYYDEFAFMPYNSIIYSAAQPAYSRASENARRNKAPYGMLITTTPGDLTTDEGEFANQKRTNATPWIDEYYDRTYDQLEGIHESNQDSTFFYIRYTYKQLGSNQDYFKRMVKGLEKDWAKIRREVLLEWATGAMNCPFSQEDLDNIKQMCRLEPLEILSFGRYGQYQLYIWDKIPLNSQYPPIIGVDVSGAMEKDSSAITIIDSQTTRVIATLNCNYIPSHELAQVIFEIVTKYMKNAIVNVERNGGFGTGVLQILKDSKIKKNLYYEIKDSVLDERFSGHKIVHKKSKVISFGTNNTFDTRNNLIELLHMRVKFHKDKFLAPILHSELTTMEVKKNGKTEHASNSHDDQVFSYLMALYVWYFGENLMERFHIFKNEIKTDQNMDDSEFSLDERYGGLEEIESIALAEEDDISSTLIEEQTKILESSKSMSLEEFYEKQKQTDDMYMEKILSTPDGRKAVARSYHSDLDYLNDQFGNNMPRDIGDDILNEFYETTKPKTDAYDGNLSDIFKNL